MHHIWWRVIGGGGGRISPWNVPSELWGLEDGAGDGDERKTVEGRHNEEEEADEEKQRFGEAASLASSLKEENGNQSWKFPQKRVKREPFMGKK